MNSVINQILEQGALEYKNGKLIQAESSYKKAIELKPDNVAAYNNLGVVLQSLGKFDEAEACFRKTIELKPDYAMAYSNLGIIVEKLGRLNEAKVNYKKALSLDSSNKKTVIAYGELLLKLNEHNYGLNLIAQAQGVIVFTQTDCKII